MVREIETLFKSFDENGDGYVTGEEIYKSLLALGQKVTLQDAKDLI
jgi:Ca2+-binding EF-hand superfamily protein